MATFFMFGKYSTEAIKDISAKRTGKAQTLIAKYGGKVNSMYALFGDKDLVFIVDFPKPADAMKASVALTKLTGIAFSTSPAIPVEEFDKIMGEL
ncbi:MAG: GYD domain-containing protein [Deltaproteobacteria bacterium]|nr:GYD domain-containing protein [Deltaproteobacteria bacterium]